MNSPPITFRTLDEAPHRIWNEWLRGYFDGGTHDLGGSGVLFPKALVSFDQDQYRDAQGQAVELMSGVGIRVIGVMRGQHRTLSDAGRDCLDQMAYTFLVQTSVAAESSHRGNANFQCRAAAQLLRGLLLDDAAMLPVVRLGIRNFEVDQAEPILGERFYTRMIRVDAELDYEAGAGVFQPGPGGNVGGPSSARGLAFTVGTGSPEGAVTGNPGDTFWDQATDQEYRKITGVGTSTGWAIH
jgi:hypothetical protein